MSDIGQETDTIEARSLTTTGISPDFTSNTLVADETLGVQSVSSENALVTIKENLSGEFIGAASFRETQPIQETLRSSVPAPGMGPPPALQTALSANEQHSAEIVVGITEMHPVTDIILIESASSVQTQPLSIMAAPGFPAGYIGALSCVANGATITVFMGAMYAPPVGYAAVLPTTGITGFTIRVNGVPRTPISVTRQTGTDYFSLRTIIITLSNAVQYGDTVGVTYADGNVTDSNLSALTTQDISSVAIQNTTSFIPTGYFEPEYWLRVGMPEYPDVTASLPSSLPPVGSLYERRLGYPVASVLLDTTPPMGDVVLNESPTTGGMDVHLFTAYIGSGTAQTAAPGTTVVEDALGNTMRAAGVLGGSAAADSFETIGTASARYLVQYFLLDANGDGPLISAIEMGVTATRAKEYALEVQQTPQGPWIPLVVLIAASYTLDYFEYPFTTAVNLFAVRLHYRGDYYTQGATGTVTVSAQDSLSGIQSIQISHYPDFHDTVDAPGANSDGWIAFTEGTSVFGTQANPWPLTNPLRFWTPKLGKARTPIVQMTAFGANGICACTSTTVYTTDAAGVLKARYTVAGGATVTALTTYAGRLYIGLSSGVILMSISGTDYASIPTGVSLSSITAMIPFQNSLWVGTAAATTGTPPHTLGAAEIYQWNGTSFTLMYSIVQNNTAALSVKSMAVAGAGLYVAVGGTVGDAAGAVYSYISGTWTCSYKSGTDSVDAICYLPVDNRIWAGLSGGALYGLSFDSTGAPATWSRIHDTQADTFQKLVADPAGKYLFACYTAGTSTAVLAYQASNAAFSDVSSAYDMLYGPLSYVSATTTASGFICSNYSENYTFYLSGPDTVNLSIGNALVLSSTGGNVQASVRMTAGAWVPISLQYTAIVGSAPATTLSWSSLSTPQAAVPSSALASSLVPSIPIPVGTMAYIWGVPIGAGMNGKLYSLDVPTIFSTNLMMYVNYQDAAGNMTFPTGVSTGLLGTTDDITRGIEQVNGASVPQGAIYQISQIPVQTTNGSITTNTNVVATFMSSTTDAVYAPGRDTRKTGTYESDPFYAPALTAWQTLSFIAQFFTGQPYSSTAPNTQPGMEYGMQVALYVRTGNTQAECFAAAYSSPLTVGNLNNTSIANGAVLTCAFNIQSFTGTYLQYKLVLTTASRALTPIVQSVVLTYTASNSSCFFTEVFDTSALSTVLPYPTFRRGILTASSVPNGGTIQFGYTTDVTDWTFADYTVIPPNTVFTLPEPSSTIRFGILLVSIEGSPAEVDEFAVQMDAGPADIYMMR